MKGRVPRLSHSLPLSATSLSPSSLLCIRVTALSQLNNNQNKIKGKKGKKGNCAMISGSSSYDPKRFDCSHALTYLFLVSKGKSKDKTRRKSRVACKV